MLYGLFTLCYIDLYRFAILGCQKFCYINLYKLAFLGCQKSSLPFSWFLSSSPCLRAPFAELSSVNLIERGGQWRDSILVLIFPQLMEKLTFSVDQPNVPLGCNAMIGSKILLIFLELTVPFFGRTHFPYNRKGQKIK